jgi:hypothetical protein
MSHKVIKSGASLQQFIGDVIKETLQNKRVLESEEKSLESGEITVKDVVEKLNIIRSGRSFKDSEVKQNMEQYISDLDSAEKTALLSFLKGISEIVTAGVSGDEAFEPSENPAKVKMEKKPAQQTVKLKPTVIKKPASEEKEGSSKKAEDTTPPIKATK